MNEPTYYWQVILKYIEKMKYPVGAEIGVHRGETSRKLLTGKRDLTLYMIDIWSETAYHGKPVEAASIESQKIYEDHADENYQAARDNVKEFYSRAKIMRMDSLKAAGQFENQMLNFVFIDAAHDYHSVRHDIFAWLPKIKPGGFLCGHDYGTFDGVTRAVDQLFGDIAIKEADSLWVVKVG